MIADIAKILIVLGLIFIVVKALGKRPNYYSKLYILHKAGPGLATVLAFVHGFTYVPISQTYIWTGWFLGLSLLALMFLGIFLGFRSNWIPFDAEKDKKYKTVRMLKWLLTIVVIIALATHYLIV
jgi:hypothetical protein